MNQALLGDCLEIMPTLESGSVDCIITDLPYGTVQCRWDIRIPFEPLWKEYKRIIKQNGAIVLFASQPFTSVLIVSNLSWFKYCWVWEKDKAANILNANRQPLKLHEDIAVFSDGQSDYYPQKESCKPYRHKNRNVLSGNFGNNGKDYNPDGYTEYNTTFPKSIMRFPKDLAGHGIHPTQKPVALIEYLVRTYTDEGETVLDSCAGSFTTAIACINTNRKYICIEKDINYYSIGCKRIEQAQSQGTLFTADGLHLNEEE
jgi:site-specific DNA-methyltransferase (adenine-specific)